MADYKASQRCVWPAPVTYESVVPNPKLKLLEQVREVMRLKHYSIRTERTYCDWVRRYVQFHQMKWREAMLPAEPKMEAFLSHLAVEGKVAVSTQNQAFNALLFVYREVLHVQVGRIESVRATRPARVPTVLTPEEAKRVITVMSGTTQLVVKLIYGSGLRLLEALRLRVHDLDFEMKQLTVRDGKGARSSNSSPAATATRKSPTSSPSRPKRSATTSNACTTSSTSTPAPRPSSSSWASRGALPPTPAPTDPQACPHTATTR